MRLISNRSFAVMYILRHKTAKRKADAKDAEHAKGKYLSERKMDGNNGENDIFPVKIKWARMTRGRKALWFHVKKEFLSSFNHID